MGRKLLDGHSQRYAETSLKLLGVSMNQVPQNVGHSQRYAETSLKPYCLWPIIAISMRGHSQRYAETSLKLLGLPVINYFSFASFSALC